VGGSSQYLPFIATQTGELAQPRFMPSNRGPRAEYGRANSSGGIGSGTEMREIAFPKDFSGMAYWANFMQKFRRNL
jgi:hypothetical protein